MSANITAASLWRDRRPGEFEGLPEFVAPMGSPIAQFSVYKHYHMAAEERQRQSQARMLQ